MTKEEIIDNIARLNSETWRDREEVRTEIGKLLAELKKALEQPTSDDCVSRQAVLAIANDSCLDLDSYEDTKEFCDEIKDLPPVTPTQCIAAVRFSKEDLRDICNELIEVECTHGTCRECKNGFQTSFCSSSIYGCEIHKGTYKYNFYCADFEKRGSEDGSN